MLTCDYGTSWLGVNALVVLTMLLIVSIVYLISRNLPSNTRGKLTGVTKVELTQIFISIVILLILFAVSSSLCAITQSISSSTATSYLTGLPPVYSYGQPFPALASLGTFSIPVSAAQDPFSYAESYVGQYAFNIGPELGIQIFSYSYGFSVVSIIWDQMSSLVGAAIPTNPLLNNKPLGPVSVSVQAKTGVQLGTPYGTLSAEYIDLLAPLTSLGVGIMLGQYLILVISNATAFVLLLPLALILRSVAFSGGLIRRAANSLLAIAIALYIIYPVMVVFDAYALTWMFSPCSIAAGATSGCNPSATYLAYTYTLTPFTSVDPCAQGGAGTCTMNLQAEGSSSAQFSLSTQNILGLLMQQAVSSYGATGTAIACGGGSLISEAFGGAYESVACYLGDQTIYAVQATMLELSEFLFTVVVMFAINVTVTVGFAVGLTRALDSGVEGVASFWSGL